MTRIQGVSLSQVRLRFHEPVRFGHGTIASQDIGILRLSTDDGLVGLGEVPGPRLPRDVQAAVELAAGTLVGHDPSDAVNEASGVLGGAIVTAALDVLGQREGRSVAYLLGGGRPTVAVNGLLVVGRDAPDSDATRAGMLVAAGYRTIKIKPAVGTARATVTDCLRAVRAMLGPEVCLRLDLNGDLTERSAIDWLTTLDGLVLEYVEQPIDPSLGVAAMARVREAIPMPLAADESVASEVAAEALLDSAACDVLVVKPSRVGGPLVSSRIARMAAAAGVAVTISTLYDSGVGLSAALHVAATIPGDRAHGLGTAGLLVSDLIEGGLPIVGGRMALPVRPGLGVTLDPSAMASAMAQSTAAAVLA